MADIPSLKQALAVSPDNVPLLLMLGEAYLEQFSLDDAKSSYEAVLRVDPVNPHARVQLVQILNLEGRSSEAILRLEQICGEHPNFAPAWLLRATLANKAVYPFFRVALHPLSTFAVFALVMYVYHLPRIYDIALINTSLHHGVHVIILVASLMLWWPSLSPLTELPRPPYIVRLAYLFLVPVSQLPIFAGITFAPEPLYQMYANMPTRAFGLSVLEDQAIAGVIMKVFGVIAFGIPFIVTFFNWYRSELAPGRPQRPGDGGRPVSETAA